MKGIQRTLFAFMVGSLCLSPVAAGGSDLRTSDGRANVQRGVLAALEPSGFCQQADPFGQRRENARLIGTSSPLRVRLRSFAGMEQGTRLKEPVCFS